MRVHTHEIKHTSSGVDHDGKSEATAQSASNETGGLGVDSSCTFVTNTLSELQFV